MATGASAAASRRAGKAIHRRHADPAADEQRGLAAGGDVKAVAKAGQRPERLPRPALRKPVGAFADDLVEDGHAGIIRSRRRTAGGAGKSPAAAAPETAPARSMAEVSPQRRIARIDLRGERGRFSVMVNRTSFKALPHFQTGSPPDHRELAQRPCSCAPGKRCGPDPWSGERFGVDRVARSWSDQRPSRLGGLPALDASSVPQPKRRIGAPCIMSSTSFSSGEDAGLDQTPCSLR